MKLAVKRLARFALVVTVLMGIWLLLSGRLYPQYLTLGAAGSVAIALATFPWRAKHSFPVMRFLRFVPWHLYQVLVSNLRVAKVAISPQRSIEPQFIRVEPGLSDERALTLLGCAVTLTPGTLTVEIDSRTMLVHSLDAASAEDIRQGIMAEHVAKVFA